MSFLVEYITIITRKDGVIMNSLFSKFVVSWIGSDDIEVYDDESCFNSRIRDLIGWGR